MKPQVAPTAALAVTAGGAPSGRPARGRGHDDRSPRATTGVRATGEPPSRGTNFSRLWRRLAGVHIPAPSLTLAVLFAGRAVLAVGGWTLGGEAGGVPVWMVADGTLLAAALVDLLLSPGPAHVVVRREAPDMLSLHQTHRIKLTVENRSKLPLHVIIRDEPSPALLPPLGERRRRSRRDALSARVEPQATSTVTYAVTPRERGTFGFSGYTVTFVTRLHLWRWRVRRPLSESVRVIPDAESLLRQSARAARRPERTAARRPRLAVTRGDEFERVREYVPDDESRRINWYATARRGRLMVNHYQPARNQLVVLAFDAGRLSRAQLAGGSRLDHAVSAGFGLGLAALQNGDHVGAIVFSGRVTAFLPPGRGARHMQALARMLSDASAEPAESNIGAALHFVKGRVRKRSLVCLFTDLTERAEVETLAGQLHRLRPQHVPLCASVADPALGALAAAQPTRAPRVYEKAAAQELLRSRRRAVDALRRTGVEVVDAPPSRLSASAVDAYFALKAKGEL